MADGELLIVRESFEKRLSKVLRLDLPFEGVDLKTFDPDYDACLFKDEAHSNLKKIAEVLKESPEACIRIFGYTGPPQHPNCVALALARTRAVRKALKAAGCNNRIAAMGLGCADSLGPRCELALCSSEEVDKIEADSLAIENSFDFRLNKVLGARIDFQGVDLNLFDPLKDTVEFKPESLEKVKQLAKVLKESPSTCIRIVGYAGAPANSRSLLLSLMRTRTLREALLKLGVSNKIGCKGMGQVDDLGPRCEMTRCSGAEVATLDAEADLLLKAGDGCDALDDTSVGLSEIALGRYVDSRLDLVLVNKRGEKVEIALASRPLGLTFSSNTMPITITKLVEGGHAKTFGIEIGMKVVSVNGVSLSNKSYEEAFALLREGSQALPGP